MHTYTLCCSRMICQFDMNVFYCVRVVYCNAELFDFTKDILNLPLLLSNVNILRSLSWNFSLKQRLV